MLIYASYSIVLNLDPPYSIVLNLDPPSTLQEERGVEGGSGEYSNNIFVPPWNFGDINLIG